MFGIFAGKELVATDDLRSEAIKWIKELRKKKNNKNLINASLNLNLIEWIIYFFNNSEE